MQVIKATEHGILPNTKKDVTQAFAAMLASSNSETEFVLEPGRYDFYAENAELRDYYLSNSDIINPRRLSLQLCGMNHVVFNGNGAELVFHGQTMPFTVDNSSNIIIKNLTIDWEIPLTAEGTITAATSSYIDVNIDRQYFPYEVENNTLFFIGEDWKEPVWQWGNTEFDVHTHKVAYRMGDTFPQTTQEQLPNGLVRFYGDFKRIPNIGNILVLRHNKRIHAGIFMQNSTDIAIENVTVHSTGGLGMLAQFCTNLRFRRIKMIPNTKRGRQFTSGHDDGIHLTANKGKITVEECYFSGLMDDPLNLHGVATRIKHVASKYTLHSEFAHEQSQGFEHWAQPGQKVALLHAQDLSRAGVLNVKRFTLLNSAEFEIEFDEPIPECIAAGDSMENLTCTAELVCQNNYFGSCRARGILIATPKPVLIQNNVFESAGAAILIAGDANYWYESGNCQDVTIRHNHFADCCLTSSYLGGEAIISIHPEVEHPVKEKPFHRNIVIENNVVQTSDAPVLYALSTQNLRFTSNRIIRSNTYLPWNRQKEMLRFEFCSQVAVQNNLLIGEVLGANISTRGMVPQDITADRAVLHE